MSRLEYIKREISELEELLESEDRDYYRDKIENIINIIIGDLNDLK